MKSKILNFGLLLSSLIGFLEWGKDKQMFLFQIEKELFSKLFSDPLTVLHPLTLMPLLGQILLLYTLFQKTVSKKISYIGLAFLGLLLYFMLAIGLMTLNYKIILSTIPFLILSILAIAHFRKMKVN